MISRVYAVVIHNTAIKRHLNLRKPVKSRNRKGRKTIITKYSPGAHVYKLPECDYNNEKNNYYQVFIPLCSKHIVICEQLFQCGILLIFRLSQCSSYFLAHLGGSLSTGILFTIHLNAQISVRMIEAVMTISIGAGQYFSLNGTNQLYAINV